MQPVCLDSLPYAMPAERHQVIHTIVGFGNAVENAGDSFRLFLLGDAILKAEMGRLRSISG